MSETTSVSSGEADLLRYVNARLTSARVPIDRQEWTVLQQIVIDGLHRAINEQPEHWQLAFRGSLEVLLDYLIASAHSAHDPDEGTAYLILLRTHSKALESV